MTVKKKKVVEKTIEDIVETPVEETVKPIATPKAEVKEWTYDELVILPRAEYLKVEADIKAGRAKVKQQ
ncbi:MAG: hypothetical protein J6S85_24600 [Methanobrevibacter sp.]|nr:hypothetical protein [Methanobrevibacter sp.]